MAEPQITAITDSLLNKLDAVKELAGKGILKEPDLAPLFVEKMEWQIQPYRFDEGLFGFTYHESDGLIQLGGNPFILEVKKSNTSSEYAFWHGLIQAEIYRFFTNKGNIEGIQVETPVICVVLDWGRRAGNYLTSNDREFCNKYRRNSIFVVRFSMLNKYFLEHNLIREEWDSTNPVSI